MLSGLRVLLFYKCLKQKISTTQQLTCLRVLLFYKCLAGVGGSSLLTNAQLHEKPGQQLVALIDLSGDGLSVGQQGDVTVGIHGDQAVFPQLFHSSTWPPS